jgi:S-adenosylmethionine-diacylgycerolhomoserine-N-methlytransferase
MDRMYALQRHLYDATRKYYLLGRDRLIDRLDPPAGGAVIEIGCGTARNLIVAARRWPDTHFYGVDIATTMLETARSHVARAGLTDRITLGQGDATNFDPVALFGVTAFDRVFQSYTLSMIPDWRGAIDHAASILAPGGRLSIVDFGQQERLPRWWRAFLLGWLARWHVTPRVDLFDSASTIALDRQLTRHFAVQHRGYAWSVVLERPVSP